jgi:hypothetical protein
MFVNIFYIPPPNGGRAKGPEIFSKNIKAPSQKIPERFGIFNYPKKH